jgi:hypothetical protein
MDRFSVVALVVTALDGIASRRRNPHRAAAHLAHEAIHTLARRFAGSSASPPAEYRATRPTEVS